MVVSTIVSGGQTGVDRGALEAARALGLQHGGWCPHGRVAEDGRIPDRYQLRETPSSEYAERTERNVRDSDATLILCKGEPTGGTALSLRLALQWGRPCRVEPLDGAGLAGIRQWLTDHDVHVLNIAGPRESQLPGAAVQACAMLIELFGPAAGERCLR